VSNNSPLTTRRKPRRQVFGERLQALRAARGWSLNEASRRTGLSLDMIYTVEARNPRRATEPWKVSIETAVALVTAFYPDLSLADFFPPRSRKLLTEREPAA